MPIGEFDLPNDCSDSLMMSVKIIIKLGPILLTTMTYNRNSGPIVDHKLGTTSLSEAKLDDQ